MSNRDLGGIIIIWGGLALLNWAVQSPFIGFCSLFTGYYLTELIITKRKEGGK